MKKYRKKPIVIEAAQWMGKSFTDVERFIKENSLPIQPIMGTRNGISGLIIHTLEGDHVARTGDWIIKGVKGEFYPCKPDIFEQTYEKVQDEAKNTL